MPSSSIDLQFDELAEPLNKWRENTVEVATLGVPPHITLLYPWRDVPLKDSDIMQLEKTLENFEPFNLCFDKVCTFEIGVVYLALADEHVPRTIMKAIFRAFPDTPPYKGAFADPSPHLTVAKCSSENVSSLRDEIAGVLDLPIELNVSKIFVMEEREDGQWFNRHAIMLQPN